MGFVGGVLEEGLDGPKTVAIFGTEVLVGAEGFDGDNFGASSIKEQHLDYLISSRI